MQDEMDRLRAENKALKDSDQRREMARPKLKWGCYQFEGETDRLYRTACYDGRGKKHLTSRLDTNFRRCGVCQAVVGAG